MLQNSSFSSCGYEMTGIGQYCKKSGKINRSLRCRRFPFVSGKIRSGVGLGRGKVPEGVGYLAPVLLPNEFCLKRTGTPGPGFSKPD